MFQPLLYNYYSQWDKFLKAQIPSSVAYMVDTLQRLAGVVHVHHLVYQQTVMLLLKYSIRFDPNLLPNICSIRIRICEYSERISPATVISDDRPCYGWDNLRKKR